MNWRIEEIGTGFAVQYLERGEHRSEDRWVSIGHWDEANKCVVFHRELATEIRTLLEKTVPNSRLAPSNRPAENLDAAEIGRAFQAAQALGKDPLKIDPKMLTLEEQKSLDAVFWDWCLEQGGVPLTCDDCGSVDQDDVNEGWCPYNADVNNEQVPATLCSDCYGERCADI